MDDTETVACEELLYSNLCSHMFVRGIYSLYGIEATALGTVIVFVCVGLTTCWPAALTGPIFARPSRNHEMHWSMVAHNPESSAASASSNDQQVDKRLGFKVSCRIWWSLFNHHVPPWLALRSGTGGPCSPHCPAGNARRVSFSTSVGIIRGLEKSHCEQVMCMFITYWFSCVPALRQSCTTASYHCISNWENWGQNWKRFSRSSVLNVHRRLPNSMRAVKHISVSGWRNGADCGPISKAASPRDSCERCPAWRNSELSPACLISWSWSWIVCLF